ncbi:MAG: hypothetical protein AB1801_12725, partial [Chloroflexota bacterium]
MFFLSIPSKIFLSDRFIAALLVLAALIQGSIFAAVFPPWQAPDETAHFQAVEMLVRLGRFAGWHDYGAIPLNREFVASLQEHRFWQRRRIPPPSAQILASQPAFRDLAGLSAPVNAENYPPLYYWILSFFYRLAPPLIEAKLYILRATSVVLLAAIVFMAWQTSKPLFAGDRLMAVSIPLMLIFLPMHIHINSAITTDVLAEFICTALFAVLMVGFKDGFSRVRLGLIILLLMAGVYTKRTTFFTMPVAAGALVLYYARRMRS